MKNKITIYLFALITLVIGIGIGMGLNENASRNFAEAHDQTSESDENDGSVTTAKTSDEEDSTKTCTTATTVTTATEKKNDEKDDDTTLPEQIILRENVSSEALTQFIDEQFAVRSLHHYWDLVAKKVMVKPEQKYGNSVLRQEAPEWEIIIELRMDTDKQFYSTEVLVAEKDFWDPMDPNLAESTIYYSALPFAKIGEFYYMPSSVLDAFIKDYKIDVEKMEPYEAVRIAYHERPSIFEEDEKIYFSISDNGNESRIVINNEDFVFEEGELYCMIDKKKTKVDITDIVIVDGDFVYVDKSDNKYPLHVTETKSDEKEDEQDTDE